MTGLHVNTRTFSSWLETRLRGDNTVCDELYLLSRGPFLTVLTYKGYEINGNTFYTIAQDQKSTNQNSGVRFDAATERGKDTYYGYIVDIWELDYGHDFKSLCLSAKGSICQEAGYR